MIALAIAFERVAFLLWQTCGKWEIAGRSEMLSVNVQQVANQNRNKKKKCTFGRHHAMSAKKE